MLRSMTGFGRAAGVLGRQTLEVEVKSVNHRHCEVKLGFPRNFAAFELPATAAVREKIERGRIDVYARLSRNPETAPALRVDRGIAAAIVAEARKLSESLELPEDLSLLSVMQFPGVLVFEDEALDPEEVWRDLRAVLDRALDQLIVSKLAEGAALAAELGRRVARLRELAGVIESHREAVIVEYRDKLAERIRQLSDNAALDENRIATEAAFFADRCDITEEVVRFRTHLARFEELLAGGGKKGRYESVGRALDFVVQELLREANTMASKSSSMQIIAPALEMKGEIEKIREQVQNVE
ncbi:YicC family protein [bacterium]|nr:YicC family protein [bacterium]